MPDRVGDPVGGLRAGAFHRAFKTKREEGAEGSVAQTGRIRFAAAGDLDDAGGELTSRFDRLAIVRAGMAGVDQFPPSATKGLDHDACHVRLEPRQALGWTSCPRYGLRCHGIRDVGTARIRSSS